jgi:hypothetical protein
MMMLWLRLILLVVSYYFSSRPQRRTMILVNKRLVPRQVGAGNSVTSSDAFEVRAVGEAASSFLLLKCKRCHSQRSLTQKNV